MEGQREDTDNQKRAERPEAGVRWNLVVPGTARSLLQIRDLISHIAQRIPFAPEISNEIEMAVDEACSNIVEHAYRDQNPPGPIKLHVEVLRDRLEISISDDSSIDFPVDAKPQVGVNEYINHNQRRGMGLLIIHNFMDDVRHRHIAGHGNELLLIKYFS